MDIEKRQILNTKSKNDKLKKFFLKNKYITWKLKKLALFNLVWSCNWKRRTGTQPSVCLSVPLSQSRLTPKYLSSFYFFIDSFIWKVEWQKQERWRKRSSIKCFTPGTSAKARAKPEWNQKLGITLRSSKGVSKAQGKCPSFTAFLAPYRKLDQQQRLELEPGTLIWDSQLRFNLLQHNACPQ